MSTYLLAIVVGNLTSTSRSVPSISGAAVNVSVGGTPDRCAGCVCGAAAHASFPGAWRREECDMMVGMRVG